jgi:hypothetical protein
MQNEIKNHVSFSELKNWMDCPYRHKLIYIDKIKIDDSESHYLHYGTILHQTIENFLFTKEMKIEEAVFKLTEAWSTHGFDSSDYITNMKLKADSAGWNYVHGDLNNHISWAKNCLSNLKDFLDENFGDWEMIKVEEQLYENTIHKIFLDDHLKFKGFIDAILKSKIKDKRGKIKEKYWILDWKTASARGWAPDKIQDIKTWAQLAFYKKIWSNRELKDFKNIGCAFILLKKTAGKNPLKRIDISVGPKAIEKIDKSLSQFVNMQRNKFYIKNMKNCKFCEYKNTAYCTTKGSI